MTDILEFPASARSAEIPRDTREDHGIGDEWARQRVVDPCVSFVVEAPAGSGKTGLLVQRFLRLLSSVHAPEEILAITFTRKATAELRERILHQLEAAAADVPLSETASVFERQTRNLAHAALERDRTLGWRLLEQPRRLRVQTIDSLCVEIVGTLPLLSGTVGYRPVDDPAELTARAARNTILQLGGENRELHEALETVLLHRDGNLADVESLLSDMLVRREQWAELIPLHRALLSDEALDQQVRPKLERALETLVCGELTRALHTFPPQALTELAALAHAYADAPGHPKRSNPLPLCREHPGPPGAEAAHLDHWHALLELVLTGSCGWRKSFSANNLGFELPKQEQTRLKALIEEISCEPLRQALEAVRCLPSAKYPDDQWRQAKALFRLLLHSLAELKVMFAERGECDFTEFSLAARHALSERPDDLPRSSGVGLRHLLVDEMQDTSSAQYELLTALTRSWDGSSQTVFLVGDPKQSIYLFRQARVERFLRTTAEGRLGDIPLESLRLTSNFRSRPEVVTAVNTDFARLFASPDQPLSAAGTEVPFVAAVATRTRAGSGVLWHTRVEARAGRPASRENNPAVRQAGEKIQTGAEEDAKAIRMVVERWLATPLPPERQAGPGREERPWRIAVLANSRSHLVPVAAEFRRNDGDRQPVPYRALKVETLQDRPEVLDAMALARALSHPADRTAWFAVLRGPWCGLSSADLLKLAREADAHSTKSTVLQLLRRSSVNLSEEGRLLLRRALPILKQGLEEAHATNLKNALSRFLEFYGVAQWMGIAERENTSRFLRLLQEESVGGVVDFHKVKLRLKSLYAETPEVPGAVELLTIHGAKGLEWDVVLVPGLGRRGQHDANRLLNWLELDIGGSPTVLLAPIHRKGDKAGRLYEWLNGVHSSRAEAERKRVFYVACTRAREELHLFATARQTGTGEKARLTPDSGSLLSACWPAAEPHFDAQVERPDRCVVPFPSLDTSFEELALAASADTVPSRTSSEDSRRFLPRLLRLPLAFEPGQRLREAAARQLPYTLSPGAGSAEAAARPGGSVAVRAMGNVVHRFLEHAAYELQHGATADALLATLPDWLGRLTASFRAEGLSAADAARSASRGLQLLAGTLQDAAGRWLLSPHADAASERPLVCRSGLVRADRVFRAGALPGEEGTEVLWIVDFKTSEPGGRSLDRFLREQRELYHPQLRRYAEAFRRRPENRFSAFRTGLYFPAIPHLEAWNPADVAP